MSTKAENAIEIAWQKIFAHFKIVDKINASGYFDISASDIKEIGAQEPRLMTKFDYRKHLPKIMQQHQMALLAIENGTYRIGRFDPYIEIAEKSSIKPIAIAFPSNILSIDPKKLAHESLALDASHVSGILAQLCKEHVDLTIRGRTRNAPFSFKLNGISFPVKGVQIEVDGGYEGAQVSTLLKPKLDLPAPSIFGNSCIPSSFGKT